MELNELTGYKKVVIQCHDIPDADTVGSGYALQCYLRSFGADVRLVYGGHTQITKPSLVMMLEAMNIHIDYVKELPDDIDLLVTVDCQRGAGNVQSFDISDKTVVVVIDHHRAEIEENENTVIRPYLSSCATVIYDMLCNEDFLISKNMYNALFYGLYTDTNGLSELRHPLDRDLAEVPSDLGLIRKLKNSTITTEELDIIGRSLQSKKVFSGIGIFKAEACDANLLGFASDIAQQVVHIDCCVVYCIQPFGIKLSIRSSVREIMGSEIAAFLCKDAGSGGGSVEKAGGFLSLKGIEEASGGLEPEEFLIKRIKEYLEYYDHIYADNNNIDFNSLKLYKKLRNPVGFTSSTDIFPAKTKITIRTLEGDIDLQTDKDIYFMIGIMGEVYPIKKERFDASYDSTYTLYNTYKDYIPIVINRFTGERRNIASLARVCIPKDEKLIRAVQLTKPTKVFTSWDTEKYFSGSIGDWLVANEGSYDDCYIVSNDIFDITYAEV